MQRFIPKDDLERIKAKVPCRNNQLSLLDSFLFAKPPVIHVNGVTSTGKTLLLRTIFEETKADYIWVNSEQCSTIRILLQRALREVKALLTERYPPEFSQNDEETLEEKLRQLLKSATHVVHGNTAFDVVAEHFPGFAVLFKAFIDFFNYQKTSGRHIYLVLDRIDQLPDNVNDLYSCFTRIREMAPKIDCLTTIFVTSSMEPRPLILSYVPHVKFTPYSTAETNKILVDWGKSERARFHEIYMKSKTEFQEQEAQLIDPALSASNSIDSTPITTPTKNKKLHSRDALNMMTRNGSNGTVKLTEREAIFELAQIKKSNICILPSYCLDAKRAEFQQHNFWDRFCGILITGLNSYTGSDIRLLKDIAIRVWPAFIYPVLTGKHTVTEFRSLWREGRQLFETEMAITDTLIYKSLDPLENADEERLKRVYREYNRRIAALKSQIENSGHVDTRAGASGSTAIANDLMVSARSPTKRDNGAPIVTKKRKSDVLMAEVNGADIELPHLPAQKSTKAKPNSDDEADEESKKNNEDEEENEDDVVLISSKEQIDSTADDLFPQVVYRRPNKRSIIPLNQVSKDMNELPLQSKFILCAGYLASYNPPRFDIRFFSRAKEVRGKRRDTGRRKALKINPRLLAAPAFDMERMLAILHAIAPTAGSVGYEEDYNDNSNDGEYDENGKAVKKKMRQFENPYQDRLGGFPNNIDIGVQIATLTTLRLMICLNPSDTLDSKTRWKINTTWPLIKKFSDEIQLDIENFLME